MTNFSATERPTLPQINILYVIVTILIAIAIPSIIIGRAVLGIELVIALLFVPFLADRTDCWKRFGATLKTPLALCIAVTFATWLPSLIESSDPARSFFAQSRLLIFIAAATLLWSVLVQDSRLTNLCLRIFTVVTAILASIAVIGMLGFSEITSFIRGNGWAEYNAKLNMKEIAASFLLCIPLILWAGHRLKRRWLIASFLITAELIFIIWLTENKASMAGLLGIILAVTPLIILRNKNTKTTLLILLMLVIAIGSVFAWLVIYRSWTADAFSGADWLVPTWLIDPPRQEIWAFAWHAGENARWFGVGPNVIDKLPGARTWNNLVGTRNIPLHPHNWAIEIIVEVGIIGLTTMLITIALGVFRIARDFYRTGAPALLVCIAIWAGYWSSGLFNFSFWSSWWQISFLIATAICLAGREDRKNV